MAKIITTWDKIKRGDIISFRYKNKEGRLLLRTVLVLEPKYQNKAVNPTSEYLVHGLQIEISGRKVMSDGTRLTRVEQILEEAGKVEIVDKNKRVFKVRINENTLVVYKKLRMLLKRYAIYRTYNWSQARKSQVFLEDLYLPQSFINSL